MFIFKMFVLNAVLNFFLNGITYVVVQFILQKIKKCFGDIYLCPSILSYVQSALKIFKAAEECRLDRDEERAYVLYMKYVTVYNLIKKRPDFRQQQVCMTECIFIFIYICNKSISLKGLRCSHQKQV